MLFEMQCVGNVECGLVELGEFPTALIRELKFDSPEFELGRCSRGSGGKL